MFQDQQSFEAGEFPNCNSVGNNTETYPTKRFDTERAYLEVCGQLGGYEDMQQILQKKCDSLEKEIGDQKKKIIDQEHRISFLEENLRKLSPLNPTARKTLERQFKETGKNQEQISDLENEINLIEETVQIMTPLTDLKMENAASIKERDDQINEVILQQNKKICQHDEENEEYEESITSNERGLADHERLITNQEKRVRLLEGIVQKLKPLNASFFQELICCNIQSQESIKTYMNSQFQEFQHSMRTYIQSELEKTFNPPSRTPNPTQNNINFEIDPTERKSSSMLPQKQNLGNQSEGSKLSTNGFENSTYDSEGIHDSSRPPIKNGFGIRGPNFWKDDLLKDVTSDDLGIKGRSSGMRSNKKVEEKTSR